MRRPILAAVLVLVMMLAAVLTARAAGVLAGQWTANYLGHPLVLQLKGSGNAYSGTYTVITKTKVATKTYKTVLPVKAAVKVVNKITTVTLTFTKNKNKTVVDCAMVKGVLRCIAANQQVIVFKHTHS
jgi:hypothetical protein